MFKDKQAEISEVQGWQIWVERTYEIFVEPLSFFHLKAYSLDGLELLSGEVDYKAYAEVIQPCAGV